MCGSWGGRWEDLVESRLDLREGPCLQQLMAHIHPQVLAPCARSYSATLDAHSKAATHVVNSVAPPVVAIPHRDCAVPRIS